MLAVLSPAKKLKFDRLNANIGQTLPQFQDQANELVGIARQLSVTELRGLMKISENLAAINKERFKEMASVSDQRNSKQAAFAFAGDTYTGLDVLSWDQGDIDYAQEHVRILSGLYGLLRPLDRIQPYRLEMGSRLPNQQGPNLYAFWKDSLGQAIDQVSNGIVINCASNEYFKAAAKTLKSKVITPVFKEHRPDGLKMISFYAKQARGAFARFMVQNRIQEPDDMKNFNLDGYGYQSKLSDDDNWVFTRSMID